jgi:uncharacterized protein
MLHSKYQPRFYRDIVTPDDLACFNVAVKETDLLICADSDLSGMAKDAILEARYEIKNYIKDNPEFEKSLKPVKGSQKAPDIISRMISASSVCGVGPMAAVAGAIAETVGRQILLKSSQVIVENGGDIFLFSKTKRAVGVYAGRASAFKDRLFIEINCKDIPCGICTSSATVGHSLSFGKADAVTVLSYSAAVADACATALCNMVKKESDIKRVIQHGKSIKGIKGILVAIEDKLGIWGDMKLIDI